VGLRLEGRREGMPPSRRSFSFDGHDLSFVTSEGTSIDRCKNPARPTMTGGGTTLGSVGCFHTTTPCLGHFFW